MKKLLFSIISLAVLCGVYSCNDNDPQFYVLGGGYCVQLGDAEFRPVVYFASYYGDLDLSASKVTKDGGNIAVRSYYDNLVEITVDTTPLLSEVEGTYHFTAVSDDGQQDQVTIKLAFDGPVGELDFTDFEYSGRQLKMTVTEPVDNATHYGFYYRAMDNDALIESWAYNDFAGGYVSAGTTDNQQITIDYSSSAMRFEAITVYPAALWRDVNSLLIRIDLSEGKILKRGASSFED